ncbi:MAG: MBL fold metallo-hydrolase [Ferrimicrobium sp.]
MKIVGQSLWVAQTNSWLISADDKECVVIDAPPEPFKIIELAQQRSWRIVAIVATHGHIDHIGGVRTLDNNAAEPIPVYRHKGDAHMMADPIGTAGLLGPMVAEMGLDVRPPEQIIDLADNDQVQGAGLTIRALHTPGHTKGSICLLVSDENGTVLFSGDHLFAGSIGRTDLPGGSLEELMNSMSERILPLPDTLKVYPGHGATTTIGAERTTNPFLAGLTMKRA